MTITTKSINMDHLINKKEIVISRSESPLMGKLILMENEDDGRIRISKVIKYNDKSVLQQNAVTLTRDELAEIVKAALK